MKYVTISIKQASSDKDILAANSVHIIWKLSVQKHTSLTNLIPWLIQSPPPVPFSQPITYTT